MLAEQSEALERSLWFALKTVDEQATENGREWLARSFLSRMHEAEQHAASLRMLLEHPVKLEGDSLTDVEGAQKTHSAD